MKQSIEQIPERIPTKAEVTEVISRFAENPDFIRELSDEQGLYLLEMKVEGKKPGETIEYQYIRKGEFPNKVASSATEIHILYCQDGVPSSSNLVAVYKSETGEWEMVK